jgi:GNAT superfamily N-acetyltransferase
MPRRRIGTRPRRELSVLIRRAGSGDLESVRELLAEGGRYMVARGEPQVWPDPFPADRVAPYLERGCVFVAVSRSYGTLGTFLLVDEDPGYWGERSHPSAHLHRMAVRRAFAGRGVGRRMVEWAVRAAQGRGARVLRLECLRGAGSLRAYYESLGFRPIGDGEVEGLELALYERPLPGGDRTTSDPGIVRAPSSAAGGERRDATT